MICSSTSKSLENQSKNGDETWMGEKGSAARARGWKPSGEDSKEADSGSEAESAAGARTAGTDGNQLIITPNPKHSCLKSRERKLPYGVKKVHPGLSCEEKKSVGDTSKKLGYSCAWEGEDWEGN